MARFEGAVYDGPPRGYGRSGATKLYIAIHNTSNDATPRQEAAYAKRRTDNVSSHFYADPETVIQSLDTRFDAWHAGSRTGNTRAIAWELTGYNSWSAAYWRKVIDRVAPVLADVCRAHGIEVRWLTVDEMRDGKSTGFVTHDDMRRAWGGTTHTDPGPNFPRAYLVDAVRRHMGAPPAPPVETPAPPKDWTASLIMSLPVLRRGSTGQPVRNLQALVNAHGGRLVVDGRFGPKTEAAVTAFQRSRRLLVDGIVGRQTWTALITR